MHSLYLNHNGNLTESGSFNPGFSNRLLRYGDGFFESIRAEMTKALWWESHYQRIKESALALGMDLARLPDSAALHEEIAKLLIKNNHQASARVRLTVYRGGGGLYKAETDTPGFFIESDSLEGPGYDINPRGLLVDVFSEVPKPINALSGFKTANALIYVLAANHARKSGLDDCLLLNADGFLAEACSSNLFMVMDGKILTPGPDQGCVMGIMRRQILRILARHKQEVEEVPLHPTDLEYASEVFITNAVKGVQWIGGYKSKRYFNQVSKQLLVWLNEARLDYLSKVRL